MRGGSVTVICGARLAERVRHGARGHRRVLRKIQPGKVRTSVESIGAPNYVDGVSPEAASWLRHYLCQPHGGAGLGGVERRVGVVDVKAPAVGRSAVGVDADDRVGAQRVGHRGALVDAGATGRRVIASRHRLVRDTELSQFLADAQHHIPVEGVFGVRRRRWWFLSSGIPLCGGRGRSTRCGLRSDRPRRVAQLPIAPVGPRSPAVHSPTGPAASHFTRASRVPRRSNPITSHRRGKSPSLPIKRLPRSPRTGTDTAGANRRR